MIPSKGLRIVADTEFDDLFALKKRFAENALKFTEGQKEVKVWAFDWKQFLNDHLNAIEALEFCRRQVILQGGDRNTLDNHLMGIMKK